MVVPVTAHVEPPNARARIRPDHGQTPCKYAPELGFRVQPGHHDESLCPGASKCEGCFRCHKAHCYVCAREHVDRQTCAGCVGRIRADLIAIVELYAMLPGAALDRPCSDIPGGQAQVLMGPYSPGNAALALALRHGDWTELDDDGIGPEPPLLTLATWEDDWRREYGHGAGPTATIAGAAEYLGRHLHTAAQEHPAFDEFAADITRTRARVQAARDDADPTVHGVACFDCGHALRQTFADAHPCTHQHAPCGCDQGGRRDTWECTHCRRTYTEHDYRRAVRQAHADVQPWRRASEVTAVTGVPAGTLRRWAHQGAVSCRQATRRGWSLYHLGEVRRHAMNSGTLAG